jgi:predicted helicase
VVIVGVNDDRVREMIEERAFLSTEQGYVDNARSIGAQIGLAKAIKDFKLSRVISFHSRVELAKDFAASFPGLVRNLKNESRPEGQITYTHIDGKMPTSRRTSKIQQMNELTEGDCYLIGNARCLSEGIDVPALDGVAFIDPKRSQVDILQAVGRAIRLSEGKQLGTIVVPVFVAEGEDPDEILSRSEFNQVWQILNALRSHDEVLGEHLDNLRVGLGRRQKISSTRKDELGVR